VLEKLVPSVSQVRRLPRNTTATEKFISTLLEDLFRDNGDTSCNLGNSKRSRELLQRAEKLLNLVLATFYGLLCWRAQPPHLGKHGFCKGALLAGA
jgi:hypothetical protein